MIARKVFTVMVGVLLIMIFRPALAMDSEITRRTLSSLPGFYVVFEELQPNIRQHAVAALLTREHLLKDLETRLQKAQIRVFSQDQWLNTKGRPVLYANVNTHVEGLSIAYNIRVEARQLVFTDGATRVKTLAGTWGITMTGMTRADKLDIIRQDLLTLVDKFIEAYWVVNNKDNIEVK